MFRQINDLILKSAPRHQVKDSAPSTEIELFNSPSLVVWSGASENTIYQDTRVNWAFRALHDALHLETGLGFSVPEEIELGRIQANQYTGLMADLIYIEVAGQAEHYLKTGQFVKDQVAFTLNQLNKMRYKINGK